LRTRSFRREVLLGYGIATALTAVVLGWGLVNLYRLGQASDAILRENYRSILAAQQMRDAIQRQQAATTLMLVKSDRALVAQLSGAQEQFLSNLAKAEDNITVPGEREVLSELRREYNEYLFHFAAFVQLPRTDTEAGLVYYRENLEPRVGAIQRGCDRLLDLNQSTMVESSDRAGRVAHAAIWSMLAVGGGAIALGIVFSMVLSTRVSKPVRELAGATQRVAAGDYGVNVAGSSYEEFTDLARHFNAMVDKLRTFDELRLGEIVAEKKKTEAILQTIDDGIFVADSRRRILSMNPAAARVFGLIAAPTDRPHLREVVPHEGLLTDIEAALESGKTVSSAQQDRYLTIRFQEKDSHYEYSITPIQAAAGSPTGVVVVLRNVTRLRELDRLKSEFVMTASHELRTPLTSIEMSVHLLRERAADALDQSNRELLEVAYEEVVRLKNLVNELLDLTRIESGRIELVFVDVSPRRLLENAVEPFRVQAGGQSVELLLDVPADVSTIRCDPNKITWVITNLVGNALRYTPPGGHVWISAERAGKWVHVYVRDDGAGIPYDKQAAIFGKFVQVGDSGPVGGAGLGLAISKEIVRAHRGNIWVESEPGKGSLFTVALPL
jgi:NtrC-family two-component system sensor histidine kinase KinB